MCPQFSPLRLKKDNIIYGHIVLRVSAFQRKTLFPIVLFRYIILQADDGIGQLSASDDYFLLRQPFFNLDPYPHIFPFLPGLFFFLSESL